MNALPGPVWVFGAWAVERLGRWALALPCWIMNAYCNAWNGWETAGMIVLNCLSLLLPAGMLGSLIVRKRFAMSAVCWYATLRIAYHFVTICLPLLQKPGPLFRNLSAAWLMSVLLSVLMIGIWFIFLRFLERSETLGTLFPKEERRRMPWWAVAPMAALVLTGN